MPLSDRVRPTIEAAPWVIEEIKRLETELAEAYEELHKLRSEHKSERRNDRKPGA